MGEERAGPTRTSRSRRASAPRDMSPPKRRWRTDSRFWTPTKVKAGKIVVGYFGKLPDPADHPVFTLTPAT